MPSHSDGLPHTKNRAFIILSCLNAAFLLAILLVESVIGERRWWATVLTYMPQLPLLLPTSLLVLAAVLRRRWGILLGNVPAFMLGLALLGVNIPLQRASSDGAPVRVMTWNAHHLAGGRDRVIDAIARYHPDIVCLQEARELPLIHAGWLQHFFPGWTMAKGGEVVVLSRYPVIGAQRYPTTGGRVMLAARLEVNGTPLTVINVHYATSSDASSLTNHAHSRRAYLRETVAIRAVQTQKLLDIAAQAGTNVVIAGDFNTPPRGQSYRRIARQYPDAFRTTGIGIGYTYPARFPLERIDHLFASSTIVIQHCICGSTTASDHLPVIVDMQLPR